jgi:two-component system cell cycle response regulator
MRALIVEPSRMIRNIFVSLFSKNGIQAVGVETAAEALGQLAGEPVDFLCFAMQLSDMTGLEFYAAAKERGLIGKHPSVMLTGSQETVGAAALGLGITECFSKSEPAVFEEYVTRWAARSTAKLRASVLLIEDSAVQAGYLEKLLHAQGLKTARSGSGEEALALLARQSFDLVLVDYVLEGALTGLNVIRRIRGLPGRTGKIPILAISGFDDVARRVEMLHSGANDFVLKPVVPEEFQVRVGNLVQLRQALDYLEEQHAILYEMAMRDRLTSVYNRHYISERSQTLIQEAKTTRRPLSLITLDIDHFKRINDNHGHSVGDHVLVAVAAAVTQFLGDAGIVARMGGEEFMAVLPDCDEFRAVNQAEALRELIEELAPSGLRVTASFGVAQLHPEEGYETVFGRADMAMYQAKRAGRNCVFSGEGGG